MKTLLIIVFETGDTDCRYLQVPVILHGDIADAETVSDSFISYLDSTASDDKEFNEMVNDVLGASGYKWDMVTGNISACDCLYTIRL